MKEKVATLEISLNIDGIPLFKSTNKSLWPVLCVIHIEPQQVFPVALTFGQSKPTNLDFLSDTIQDLNHLIQHGLQCTDRNVPVKLRAVFCDAPAKAMVKAVKQFSGYYGCDKCAQKGLWIGRITYPESNQEDLRTDDSFRTQTNAEHHTGMSTFCDIPNINMIKSFPIDYMHQACLGVMKRLLLTWMRGKKEVRISAGQSDQISRKLTELWQYVPREFARKPRSLGEIDRWKVTEYRQFLLYTGKIVLCDILKPKLYSHFLTFSVAMNILVCPPLARSNLYYAKELLEYFVAQSHHFLWTRILGVQCP